MGLTAKKIRAVHADQGLLEAIVKVIEAGPRPVWESWTDFTALSFPTLRRVWRLVTGRELDAKSEEAELLLTAASEGWDQALMRAATVMGFNDPSLLVDIIADTPNHPLTPAHLDVLRTPGLDEKEVYRRLEELDAKP